MNKKSISIESFFVMLLFIVFTISMVLMIISGKNGYKKILDSKKYTEEIRTSSSLFRMKIKQNNQVNAFKVNNDSNLDVDLLEIWHNGADSEYKTVLCFYNGKIYETYISTKDKFDIILGEPVMNLSLDQIHFNLTEKGVEIIYQSNENETKQFVATQVEE